MPFGSEANGSHLRPRRSGTITATGIPIDRGRGSHVWEIKIHDEDEKLVYFRKLECVTRKKRRDSK